MTEERVEGTEATPEGSPPAEPPTAEQVEAEWKYRVSQKDKAHAAETKALREQIAALSGTAGAAQQQAEGSLTESEALRKQLAEAQQREKALVDQHTAELRTVKYPNAAEALDPVVLAQMDEAKLAGLEARLGAPPRMPGIDPSTPPRQPGSAPKSPSEKTAAELREDLRRMAPQIAAEMGRQPD